MYRNYVYFHHTVTYFLLSFQRCFIGLVLIISKLNHIFIENRSLQRTEIMGLRVPSVYLKVCDKTGYILVIWLSSKKAIRLKKANSSICIGSLMDNMVLDSRSCGPKFNSTLLCHLILRYDLWVCLTQTHFGNKFALFKKLDKLI